MQDESKLSNVGFETMVKDGHAKSGPRGEDVGSGKHEI